jgi:hypothetical protein
MMAGSLKEFFRGLFGRRKTETETPPSAKTPPMPSDPASTERPPGQSTGDGGSDQAPADMSQD